MMVLHQVGLHGVGNGGASGHTDVAVPVEQALWRPLQIRPLGSRFAGIPVRKKLEYPSKSLFIVNPDTCICVLFKRRKLIFFNMI